MEMFPFLGAGLILGIASAILIAFIVFITFDK